MKTAGSTWQNGDCPRGRSTGVVHDTRTRTLTGLKPGTAYWWMVVEARADGTVLESVVRWFVTGP